MAKGLGAGSRSFTGDATSVPDQLRNLRRQLLRFHSFPPLASSATLSDVITRQNAMLQMLKDVVGQGDGR